ncbi:MAG: hypothetical protein GY759_13995 [Chloroflexi bacterium]|nr:hypothetical protein [Chloroflexota bacterium]
MPPPITLRQVSAESLPLLQVLYEESDGYFVAHSGSPAAPDQAAMDYKNVLDSGDRVLLGIWWEANTLVGSFDLRFHHPVYGVVWFGALTLSDRSTDLREDIEAWSVRILEEWLRIGTDMTEIRTAVLLSNRERVRFWTEMAYQPTPQGIRQMIGDRSQRFAVYVKPIRQGLL